MDAIRSRWSQIGLVGLASVLGPTALSAVLVIHDLGARSLWVDEGATFAYSSHGGLGLWHSITADGGNMVAYYAAIHLVMAVFGSSPFVLRLPSALATVATVPVCFLLVRRLFDRRAATFAAFFVAGSVPLVYWGQMARGYALAVLLTTGATLAFVTAVQTGRRLAWACYCVLSVLAISTILLSALVVVAQYCSLALIGRPQRPLRGAVVSAAIIVLGALPVGIVALAHGTAQINWIAATGPPFDAANQYLFKFVASAEQGGVRTGSAVLLVVIGMSLAWALAVGFFVASLVKRKSRERFAWGVLLATSLVPSIATYAVSELVHPVLSDRYLLCVVAPASMAAGVACSRIRPSPAAYLAGLALLGARLVQIPPTYGVSLEDWRSATSYVLTRTEPHDCVAFFVSDGYPVFDYYLLRSGRPRASDPTPVLPAAPWSSRRAFELDPATFSPSELRSTVRSCPRLWLVETHQTGMPAGPGVPPYQVEKYDAYHRLRPEIHHHYTEVSKRLFTGVRIVLFVRRPGADELG